MKRNGTAHWEGTGKEGRGALSTDSGVLKNTQYSFSTRFENGIGTNPEELIAAAHAGCFTMALSFRLTAGGMTPKFIDTKASLTMENKEGGWVITGVHLHVSASVENADEAKFQALAADAKANCPVSKVLNAAISMEASLV